MSTVQDLQTSVANIQAAVQQGRVQLDSAGHRHQQHDRRAQDAGRPGHPDSARCAGIAEQHDSECARQSELCHHRRGCGRGTACSGCYYSSGSSNRERNGCGAARDIVHVYGSVGGSSSACTGLICNAICKPGRCSVRKPGELGKFGELVDSGGTRSL